MRDILTPLCKRRESIWVEAGWEYVFAQWQPIAREDLEGLFAPTRSVSGPVEVDFSQSQRGQVLYLPPLEKPPHCIPILSLYCQLNNRQSIAKLRVMLVCLDGNQDPYGIGFRMETPESMNQNANATDSDGIHDFHHAQLIRTFGQSKLDDKLRVCSPDWLPTTQPSFPLPAKCPVTLLLCLIVTLYGKKYYNQFLAEHDIFDIKQHRDILDPWINSGRQAKKADG